MMGFLQRGFAYGNRRGFAIPLPELLVEEQVLHNTNVGLDGTDIKWVGQRFLAPPNHKIAFLAFRIWKNFDPTGDVTFIIQEYPTGIPLLSKVWGDASDLPPYPSKEWQEVEFDAPLLIDVLVEMIVKFSGGDGGNQVGMAYQNTDIKPNEELYKDIIGSDPTSDASYRYKYYE
jgi:hypothetical protein